MNLYDFKGQEISEKTEQSSLDQKTKIEPKYRTGTKGKEEEDL